MCMVLFLAQVALADGGSVPLVVAIDDGPKAATLSERTTEQAPEVAASVLAAARARDHAAFATIVEHYDPRLRALAYRLLRDEHGVNDALQDAYVKAYLRLEEFRGEAGLGTWLYRIVYTTCLDHLRAASRRPQPQESGDEATVDFSEAAVERFDLEALLAELPPEQRAAVILVDAHGMGFAHTAEVLGIPQGTVASRVASARRKLRRALATRDQPEGPVTT